MNGKVPLLSGQEMDSSATKPSSEDALRGIFGPVGVPTPEAEKRADDGVEKDSGKEEGAAKKPRKRKNILRSIVYHEESSSEEKGESDTIAPRNEVDEAGVQHVVEYEKSRGRHPEVMPHYHPGYDIEAKDKWGDVVRFIEVKSLTDRWAIGNAVLSKTQFEKAAELGQRYWLYVVEKAQKDDFCLYRIQNPANRVDQFVFDDRWMALSMD